MFGFSPVIKNKFLVLEIFPETVDGVNFVLKEEKELLPEKYQFSERKNIRQKFFSEAAAIISLQPSSFSTISVPLEFEREEPGKPLDAVELENLISSAVGKIFNNCREEAAGKMREDEVGVVLVGSKLYDFLVDGHKVINPLGFKAKKIKVFLELDFTKRGILEKTKALAGNAKMFFTEAGKAHLSVLRKTIKSAGGVFVSGRETALFLPQEKNGEVFRKEIMDEKENFFLDFLAREWGIGETASRKIYSQFLAGGISAKIGKYFNKAARGFFAVLAEKIKKRGGRGEIYTDFSFPLPFAEFKSGGIVLKEMDLKTILDETGFKIDERHREGNGREIIRKLAPFLEFYYNNEEDGEINGWLKRRLHWLGASI